MTAQLRVRQVLRHPFRNAESRESAALLIAAGVLVVATVVSLLVFRGGPLPIAGPGSIGQFVALAAAVTAFGVFIAAVTVSHAGPQDARALPRMRWFDIASIAAAHGVIALLGWIGMANIVERSFVGAVVFPVSAALLAGVAIAVTAYLTTVSAMSMTPTRLSLVLMVFLVVGVFASMLSATDPLWWQKNLSTLGVSDDMSALAFNLTVIIAGLIVTTIAHFGTIDIPVDTEKARRGRRVVRIELLLMGVFLAGVGLFPVDTHFAIHNTVASGMAVLFVALVIGLRWHVPGTPRVFLMLGYAFVLIIVVLAVLFTTGYYNLTAVELIAFLIIFGWLMLFLRNTAAAGTGADGGERRTDAVSEPAPSPSGSRTLPQ
ncbi:DUF998 domain-containing protein [Microbacterium sp. LBN7]|uniref:DUF998 domain-containing protein n=1 Tax=Microbacterium sp. LBN7 TaxID=3129773 RepID=UPI00324D6380